MAFIKCRRTDFQDWTFSRRRSDSTRGSVLSFIPHLLGLPLFRLPQYRIRHNLALLNSSTRPPPLWSWPGTTKIQLIYPGKDMPPNLRPSWIFGQDRVGFLQSTIYIFLFIFYQFLNFPECNESTTIPHSHILQFWKKKYCALIYTYQSARKVLNVIRCFSLSRLMYISNLCIHHRAFFDFLYVPHEYKLFPPLWLYKYRSWRKTAAQRF